MPDDRLLPPTFKPPAIDADFWSLRLVDERSETFTVRKVSYGVGVERTFPVHSPIIEKIERVSRGDVRRAKLYYQRDRVGKAAKIKEKRD